MGVAQLGELQVVAQHAVALGQVGAGLAHGDQALGEMLQPAHGPHVAQDGQAQRLGHDLGALDGVVQVLQQKGGR